MNYLKVYCNLIRKAENRTPPEGYTEKHHTFPKSIFGKNNRIVVLTAREHYIAHALLEKICMERYGLYHYRTKKMNNAHILMKSSGYCNSYLYENARIRASNNMKGKNNFMYGKNHSEKTKNKISNISDEVRNLRREIGKICGENLKRDKKGIHKFSKEERIKTAKIAGKKCKELGVGIHQRNQEQKKNDGSKGGTKTYQLKKGAFAISLDERIKIVKKVNSQKWMCLETGYITNAGALSTYQKARNIDTSKRKRIE